MTLSRRQSNQGRRRPSIYGTETAGLIVIALLLVVIALIRYWHNIRWYWR